VQSIHRARRTPIAASLATARTAGPSTGSIASLPEGTTAGDRKREVQALAAHCAAYKGADIRRSAIQLLTTLPPFLLTCAVMIWATAHAYWFTLLLTLPAAGLLVRLFIIQHDCGHGSFLASRTANDLLGRMLSLFTLTPYGLWRREHAHHHAGSGNLNRRGIGDITTLTVREYAELGGLGRAAYRLYRHPLFLFGFGAPFYFLVLQRLPIWHGLPAHEAWRSIMSLNVAIAVAYGGMLALVGVKSMLLTFLPMVALASAAGVWLFFVQHQFEDAHWEAADDWDFQVAAVHGSSYYVLPRVLQWFTGNIGLHHIHHLNSMIPNYRLQECLDASPELASINRLTLWESLKCVRLALWDEERRKMVAIGAAA
jgi:omega-6 fatty acid desaturase (delta-12 desaturase)